MDLAKAQVIADRVVEELKPYCDKIQVAGSIRRKKPFVRDIDLIAIPSNQGQFYQKLQSLGKVKLGGQKLIRVDLPEGISADVYIASPATWYTLLLIRTGSKEHNVKLCSRAKRMGMKLHADGSGLFALDDFGAERRIAGDSEKSIFEAMGMGYIPPERRE